MHRGVHRAVAVESECAQQPAVRPLLVRAEYDVLGEGVFRTRPFESVASITSYQYSDDEMILDQDFLPLSYFTLKQARTEHALTEDIVFRSHEISPGRMTVCPLCTISSPT